MKGYTSTPNTSSLLALIACVLLLYIAGFIYYPKYENTRTEAAISWDVAGYYLYLPALFIYDDIKKQAFLDDIIDQYSPTPENIQSYQLDNGNYVMKYTMGQALTLSPFFIVAHIWASNSDDYPSDGYSYPYQLLIAIGSFLIAIVGLIYLRKILLEYFEDSIVAMALIAIVFGSNYLEYAGISSGMTHNSLFTYYALLLWNTHQFYTKSSVIRAIGMGVIIGLMALTRPTEIVAILIPILWNLESINKVILMQKWQFFKDHKIAITLSIFAAMAVGSLQLLYWKIISGDWIVYSYQNEGFSWLSPHIKECLFSYRSGWLVYSPIMIFSIFGLFMIRQILRKISLSIIVFSIVFMYVTFSWDVWWYGGSLGQRAMVQSYIVLAFPIGSFFVWVAKRNALFKLIVIIISILFIYCNIFWTHQGHRGGMLHVGQMTKEYFWKVLGSTQSDRDDLKLLDNKDHLGSDEIRYDLNILAIQDDTLLVNGGIEFSENWNFNNTSVTGNWVRVALDVESLQKEWDVWKMHQLVTKFSNAGKQIKYNAIRLNRLLDQGERRTVFMDVKVPKKPYELMQVYLWNGGSDKESIIYNITIESYSDSPPD